MTEDIRPTDEVFQQLLEYKVAIIKNDKWVYHPKIEATVAQVIRNPPDKRQQIRYGRQARKVLKTMVLYAKSFKSRRRITTLLLTYYTNLRIHFKRLNLEWPNDDDLPFILYATWYLNDHEPEVWVEEIERN